jgi:uncharacterized damage-inducible protein DinB
MASYMDWFSKEFDWEMAKTRKMLQAVPDHNPDWKPDPKSMSVGRLAGHVAELPTWVGMTILQDSLDLSAPGAYTPTVLAKGGRDQLLATFDKNVVDARAAMAGRTDDYLAKNWQLKFGGRTVIDLPRTTVLSDVCKNHLIHHRGQLSVYTRLLGGTVPGMYGPSADENAAAQAAVKEGKPIPGREATSK